MTALPKMPLHFDNRVTLETRLIPELKLVLWTDSMSIMFSEFTLCDRVQGNVRAMGHFIFKSAPRSSLHLQTAGMLECHFPRCFALSVISGVVKCCSAEVVHERTGSGLQSRVLLLWDEDRSCILLSLKVIARNTL